MKALTLLLLISAAALAQPTCSGTLRSIQGDSITVEDAAGHFWTGQLTVGFQNKTNRQLQSLQGQRLVYRVRGQLGPTRLVELVGMLENSQDYQARGINFPYFTRQGEWAGPGGVGGRAPNSPDLGQHRNIGGYSVNGGFPHQNQFK